MRKISLAAVAAVLVLTASAHAGIEPKNFDLTVKPQDDFFRYANGTWLKNVTIPASEGRWGSFSELRDRNWQNVRIICDRAAAKGAAATGAERMVGDFYASGMDETAIDAAGITPLKPELDAIAAIKTPAGVMAAIARLQRTGVSAGFGFTGQPDAKNSTMNIAQLRQGGLSLPGTGQVSDREYYLNDDEKSVTLRDHYVAHVAKMLGLAGDAPAAAQAGAVAVLKLETEFAKISLSRALLRNPQASYHKMPAADLPKFTGDLDWAAYFKATGAPAFTELNLAHPDFFKGFAAQLKSTPVADWQAYLRWHLLNAAAPYLAAPFAQENYRFYDAELRGVKEPMARWRRVVAWTDGSRLDGFAGTEGGIGDALGQLYVAEFFPPEAKVRVLKLVEDLRVSLRERIQALEWMDAATKTKALAKLDAFSVKMGYPDKWRDYRGLRIDRGPFVLNVLRAREFLAAENRARIGRPVDKTEWTMTPPTVNASYSSSFNGIQFPAGILQPPFFDPKEDDAVNYGGIGTVIGHEMTHGFDDSGRQYDAQGNLVDWWTPESAERYKVRAAGVVKQFSDYTVLDGVHLKGELTQGENIADLGGIKVAYGALQQALAGKRYAKIDGFTPEQRFFLSYANVWRDAFRDAEQRRRVNIDPHSPGEWRVRGPLSNLDEFAQAFNVPEGAPMRRPAADRVTIW
jgi:putative endopeptidase